jgi:uncharacterized protein (TIGR03382 family)
VLALTTTTLSLSSAVILDADIEFNAAPGLGGATGWFFTVVDSPPCPPGQPAANCVHTDVRNALTHEIGHAIGLDHADDPASTMYYSAPSGELIKRVIDRGTSAGFCDIYPKELPANGCDDPGEIRAKVIAENEGSGGLFGCSAAGGNTGLAVLGVLAGWLVRRRRARER